MSSSKVYASTVQVAQKRLPLFGAKLPSALMIQQQFSSVLDRDTCGEMFVNKRTNIHGSSLCYFAVVSTARSYYANV